jgi:U4/U6.U5 tri-snRNP-associated protein 1
MTIFVSLLILVVCRAVPQASEFLDAQPLAKGKTEKTKKKKEGRNAQKSAESGFMTVPAPQLHLMSNGNSPGHSPSASPAPKPGFSRISTMVDASSQDGTPAPGERPKVAFGLATKRKADEEPAASPPSKRR